MRSLLPLLPKPSRYAGIEDNACRKNPEDVRLRVALAFPDTYDVGMSYLGQKILYNIVNSEPGWWLNALWRPKKRLPKFCAPTIPLLPRWNQILRWPACTA